MGKSNVQTFQRPFNLKRVHKNFQRGKVERKYFFWPSREEVGGGSVGHFLFFFPRLYALEGTGKKRKNARISDFLPFFGSQHW